MVHSDAMNMIGACIWSLPGEDFEAKLQLAKECGLEGVQLDIATGDNGLTLADDSMVELARSLRESIGLSYVSLGLGIFCDSAATDPKQHPLLRELLDSAIEIAQKLEIPILQIPSFGASELRTDMDIVSTAELMRYTCEQTKGTRIQVCTENVLPPTKLVSFIEQVNAPNFKVYYDTANPHSMARLDAIKLLDASYPYLAQVHLKDTKDNGDSVLLGEGDTDFQQTLDHLGRIGYEGWYVLESPYSKVMATRGISVKEAIFQDLRTSGYTTG